MGSETDGAWVDLGAIFSENRRLIAGSERRDLEKALDYLSARKPRLVHEALTTTSAVGP